MVDIRKLYNHLLNSEKKNKEGAMSNMKTLSKSPLKTSLNYLKEGNVKSAQEALGITPEQAEKNDFINCMMAFEQGLKLLLTGHHPESVDPLRKAIPLIQLTNDEEAKFIVPTLADFAEGISKLLQGDAHGAVKLLNLSSDTIQKLNFFTPGLEKVLLSFKAAAELAVARTFINIGDISRVELSFGKVDQIHEELLSKLDETNPEDSPFLNEVYGSKIESALLFMRMDLDVLDFNSLDRRLESTKNNLGKLSEFIVNEPKSPIKTAIEIIKILYEIFGIYNRIGKRIIVDRLPLTEPGIKELLEADKRIFEARQKANNAGQRGQLFLYTINQLKRLHDSFFTIGKVQKKDFGRISGLISLGALIVQIIIVHFTVKPTGNAALLFFFGELIISLIVGFGYEAIKFKPLLSLYSEAIKTQTGKNK